MQILESDFFKRYKLLLLLILLLNILIIVLYIISVKENGMLVYCVDDAYIHLKIAKNLLQHNSYGINPNEFSTPSSSILYPFLIYLNFLIFGVNTYIPLIINSVFVNILAIIIYKIFNDYLSYGRLKFAFTFFIIIFSNIFIFIFTGMEHILFAVIFILFLYYNLRYLFPSDGKKRPRLIYLIAFSILLTSVRYEGIILLFLMFCIFIYNKKNKEGILIFIAGMLPIIIWGIYSVNNGAYFLPNSVILKFLFINNQPDDRITVFINRLYMNFKGVKVSSLFLITIINLITILKYKNLILKDKFIFYSNLLLIILTFNQYILGSSYFRYILHILIMNIFLLFLNINFIFKESKKIIFNNIIINIITFILVIASTGMAYRTMSGTLLGTKNIYEQQIQMSKFINEYSENESVAVNDIGAVSYYSNSRIIDLCGLSDKNILIALMSKKYDKSELLTYCDSNKVKLIIIYESWFVNRIPEKWKLIGNMIIKRNIMCGGDKVSFFLPDTNLLLQKRGQFSEFCKTLPGDIEFNVSK